MVCLIAGFDRIGGRGGGRSVGIVGNFGVGRKLGWECCGDKMWLAESCGE